MPNSISWRARGAAVAALLVAGLAAGLGAGPAAAHPPGPGAPPAPPAPCDAFQIAATPDRLTTPNTLFAAAAFAPDDGWAVGSYTLAGDDVRTLTEHWDGAAWTVVPGADVVSGTNVLLGVAAIAAGDVWAAGYAAPPGGAEQPLIEHWTAGAWHVVPGAPGGAGNSRLLAVAGTSAQDVWAVGYATGPALDVAPLIEHWDGHAWTAVAAPPPGSQDSRLQAVTALAPGDVWAAGFVTDAQQVQQPLALHWDGTAWTRVPVPAPPAGGGALAGLAAVGPQDVWAAGGGGGSTLTEHWDGTVWTQVPSPDGAGSSTLTAVAAVSAGDVWAVGDFREGTDSTEPLTLHWDGSTWAVVPNPVREPNANPLTAVVALAPTDVWAIGYSQAFADVAHALALHWAGGAWTSIAIPNAGASDDTLAGISTTPLGQAWAVGSSRDPSGIARTLTLQAISGTWGLVSSPNATAGDNVLNAVATTGDYVWAVGSAAVPGGITQTLTEETDGSYWSVIASPNVSATNVLQAVAAGGPDDVWAVGYAADAGAARPLTEHWGGQGWTVVPGPAAAGDVRLAGVTVVAPDDAWAVGYTTVATATRQTLIAHWDGSAWSIVPSPNPGSVGNTLAAVSAVAAGDVWAAGSTSNSSGTQPLTLHWDGHAWAVVPVPTAGVGFAGFGAVSARASDDVWAAGTGRGGIHEAPLTAHWDGSAWHYVPVAAPPVFFSGLSAIAASADGDVWAAGLYVDPLGTGHALVERYVPCTPVSFSDVHPSDYFYTPVAYLAAHGIISGYADGTFRPYNNTTRAQQVKIVILGFGKPVATPTAWAYTFHDVPPDAPFFDVIETAAADGIVGGYGCGGPGEPCDPAAPARTSARTPT